MHTNPSATDVYVRACSQPVTWPAPCSYKTVMNVAHEVELLVGEIKRLGAPNAQGQTSVSFGTLFSDDKCANLFEALVGTLRWAGSDSVCRRGHRELVHFSVHAGQPRGRRSLRMMENFCSREYMTMFKLFCSRMSSVCLYI